jgi:hypothetical protein
MGVSSAFMVNSPQAKRIRAEKSRIVMENRPKITWCHNLQGSTHFLLRRKPVANTIIFYIYLNVILLCPCAWILQQIARSIGAENPKYLRVLGLVALQAGAGASLGGATVHAFMKHFPDFNPEAGILALVVLATPLVFLGLTAATRTLLRMSWGMAVLLQVISLAFLALILGSINGIAMSLLSGGMAL